MTYYDMDGNVIDGGTLAWAEMREKLGYDGIHIGKDEINGYRVSTVWMGLDHSFGDGQPPLIFETMIFPRDSAADLYCERYSTKEQAAEGHKRALEMARRGEFNDEAVE